MKCDVLRECESLASPSTFAVQTIAETCATIVRTRSGSPHTQSETHSEATRSPLRLPLAATRPQSPDRDRAGGEVFSGRLAEFGQEVHPSFMTVLHRLAKSAVW